MTDHKKTILVVDDEASVRKMLSRCLERESYYVLAAADQEDAIEILETNVIDLITIDINLNGDDGLELARTIRTKSNTPIIMISGKSDLIDKVVGLEVGADDYIAKPFELREVIARVKAALRRIQLDAQETSTKNSYQPNMNPAKYQFADCLLCPVSRSLTTKNGKICELTTAEFDLLYALAGNSNQVMSRDEIMDTMKGTDWAPSDRTIDNQIARIRKKLDTIGIGNSIKTIRGHGYQFILPVVYSAESK